MLHPDTELRFVNEQVGHGVFATRPIPAGTITWVKDALDRELTPEEFKNLPEVCRSVAETYSYRNSRGNYMLCWDITRYMNHSFRPNCMATTYGFEIAVGNIKAGEQLTNDYGFLNIVAPFRPEDEGTKRKTVYPDDLVRNHAAWDRKLSEVFPKILKRSQPLRALLTEETWKAIESIVAGQKEPESIRNNFFDTKRFADDQEK